MCKLYGKGSFVYFAMCMVIYFCFVCLTFFRNNDVSQSQINPVSRRSSSAGVLSRGPNANFDPIQQTLSLDKTQSKRLRHLLTICERQPKDSTERFNIARTITMAIPKFDINYCKVPKVGSTFMTKMFKILTDENASISEIMYMPRRSLRHLVTMPNVTTEDVAFHSRPTVLLARNPYSRLYSAYIDKIYIPSGVKDFVDLQTQLHANDMCGPRPTFKDFLRYVIDTVHKGRVLDKHWAPIHALCKPCATNYSFIIKQETFSEDVKLLMNYLGVSNKLKNSIVSTLIAEREDTSVPGIIYTTFYFSTEINIYSACLSNIDTAQSFQIQGYIRDDNNFPDNKVLEYSPLSVDTVADVIMMQINSDRLSDADSKSQRLFYLKKAYEDLPRDILVEIQKIYKEDFELFDYDLDPPHIWLLFSRDF